MTTQATIKIAGNEKEIEKALEIRAKVFGEEQGISRELDFDSLDKEAKHFLLYFNKDLVGCARVRILNKEGKLERIAILKDYRGNGLGIELVEYLINYCKKNKLERVFLDAQVYLEKFYEKVGFKVIGKPFEEVGISHIKMEMKLK